MTYRLFAVSVYSDAAGYHEEHKIQAQNDIDARAKAVEIFVSNYNAIVDADKESDMEAKALKMKMSMFPPEKVREIQERYAHMTTLDITYCEVKLLQEWSIKAKAG